jgi:hypothetical protein
VRWAVVIRLKDGVELLRKEFDAREPGELARAFQQVAQTVMDDGALLSPAQLRIDVVKPDAD